MSLSLEKLDVVKVMDPRVQVTQKQLYAYVEGGAHLSHKNFVTSSVSNSSLQFNCPPPSKSVFIDRKVYFRAPIRLTFKATSTAGGQTILTNARDAPRQYGLSSAIEVMKATINNYSVSNNVADYIHPLMKFGTGDRLQEGLYSGTPTYGDQSQKYSDLVGTNMNPLAQYGDGLDRKIQRGGFSEFKIVSNPASAAAGEALEAQVDVIFTEPLFLLSPFVAGEDEVSPFYNVSTMDFNITMLTNGANRMWSRFEDSLALTSLSYDFASIIPSGQTAFSFDNTQPQVQFTYITPKQSQMIPRDIVVSYPYYELQRFITDISVSTSKTTFSSNNVQLSSIPKRIYVYARRRNSSLYASPTHTDSFAAIEGISAQYMNRTGLLSSASKEELYRMSVKNGLRMNYSSWSGDSLYKHGSFTEEINGLGSVVCINPAKDFGLDSLQASGKIDHNTLQLDIQLKSLNPDLKDYSIYVVVVNEGVFSIAEQQTMAQIGVLDSNDILNAKERPGLDYNELRDLEGGGFFDRFKNFLSRAHQFIKKNKLLSTAAKYIPGVGQEAHDLISKLGYGIPAGRYGHAAGGNVISADAGSIIAGGRKMPRKKVKKGMKRRVR